MKPNKAVHLAISLALAAAVAAAVRAQTAPPPVVVVPLNRSCAFQLRLDQIAPTLYSTKSHGPWIDPTHRAMLEWRRPGETAWKKAQDFVRLQADRFDSRAVPEPRMASMLFGLKEGETYEYRVSFLGDGFPAGPYTGSFTTKTTDVPRGSTPTVRITPDTKNISAAIKAGLSSGANKNAVVQFEAATDSTGKPVRTVYRMPVGSFYDLGCQAFTYSGAADGWLSLQGAPGADIVIDGSDPEYDTVGQGKWQLFTDNSLNITANDRIFRTTAKYFDPANLEKIYNPADALRPAPAQMYFEKEVGGDAWRLVTLWKGARWGPSQTVSTGLPTLRDRMRQEPNTGAFTGDDAGYLYVHLPDGMDPNSVHMKIGVYKSCLDITGSQYLRVSNLKFQYFSGYMGMPFAGVHVDSVQHLIFEDCVFKGLGYGFGHRVAYNAVRKDIVLKRCTFSQRGLNPEWDPVAGVWRGNSWENVKGSREEDGAIVMRANQVSILDCEFIGGNGGITSGSPGQSMGTPDWTPDNLTHSECWEIDNNHFRGVIDDCVEMEWYTVNIAVTRNRMDLCYKGWSVAPLQGGPQYFLRNTWVGRGEFGSVAYKQSMTKFGNDDPGDPAYKLMANNTQVNVNDDPNGVPLVGISASGASYNTWVFNNYIACDAYPVEWADGTLGYPHVFNGNRYVLKRPAAQFPGYTAVDSVSVSRRSPLQGESSGYRVSKTMEDWQRGKDVKEGVPYPGYQANPPDAFAYIHDLHDANLPWMHDPDSKVSVGDNTLVDPYHGDFRPKPDSDAIGQGVPLANITYDCGPAWAAYEESGRPTAGALTAGVPTAPRPNQAPSVTIPDAAGVTGIAVKVRVNYYDVDGAVAKLDISVTDPSGAAVAFTKTDPGAGAAYATFVPQKSGAYAISATATDDKGATTAASGRLVVSDPPVYTGNISVTMTASNPSPKPGEAVVYTIVAENASNHVATNATLRQAIPAQMVLNPSSAMLDGKHVSLTISATEIQVALGDMQPGDKHTFTIAAYVK